jgi:hypothetical protein
MAGDVHGCGMLVSGCWILDARYWMLDAGYSILDTGCWKKWLKAQGARHK